MKANNVEISHPDKILFPQQNITKKDVADYFERIAEYMLPYIEDRPITLKQFTEGIGKEGFFSKHAPDHFPDYIKRIMVPMHSESGKEMKMVTVDEAADLVYFAGQNTIEIHTGLSKSDDLEKPDQIIFDLDPSDNDFEKVWKAAFALKQLLDDHEITTFIKTTGSRGVHVHIPIKVDKNFPEVKKVAKQISQALTQKMPELTTMEHRKDKRGDKVFIDYLRNDYGMTVIAPYSLRALNNAPVAVPIDWDELKDSSLGPQTYTLSNIFRRVSQKKDPWKNFVIHRVDLKNLRFIK
ncbi:MAG: non-homologous end-joining DNA ligase [Cyclobacteriaceae bacterium]